MAAALPEPCPCAHARSVLRMDGERRQLRSTGDRRAQPSQLAVVSQLTEPCKPWNSPLNSQQPCMPQIFTQTATGAELYLALPLTDIRQSLVVITINAASLTLVTNESPARITSAEAGASPRPRQSYLVSSQLISQVLMCMG